ncbi:MAG TPA: hypothetical protein VGF52_05125, partial [Tepidisphaeraceae bacterium]
MDPISGFQLAVGTYRHNLQEANLKYYAWVRTCLTVASGSLALLVGLQRSFVPAHPIWIWTLQAAWAFFFLTIMSALITLVGE